jgi:hypothetical protein
MPCGARHSEKLLVALEQSRRRPSPDNARARARVLTHLCMRREIELQELRFPCRAAEAKFLKSLIMVTLFRIYNDFFRISPQEARGSAGNGGEEGSGGIGSSTEHGAGAGSASRVSVLY